MHSVYLKFIAFITVDTSKKTMGYKEGSGFTHAHNDEPITFNPMEAYEGIRDVSNGMRTKLQLVLIIIAIFIIIITIIINIIVITMHAK